MAGTDDILHRPLYLYGLPADVLASLKPVSKDSASGSILSPSEISTQTQTTSGANVDDDEPPTTSPVSSEACVLCQLVFASHADKRDHFKSDLHLFNLKQKLSGKPSLTEDEFEHLINTLDESLSGSEWSESDSLSAVDEDEEDKFDVSDDNKTASNIETADLLSTMLKKQAVVAEKKKADRIAKKASRKIDEDGGDGDDENGETVPANTVIRPKNFKQRQRESAANASLQPLVWFSSPLLPANNYFGAYRAMFAPEELSPVDETAIEKESEPARTVRILEAIHSRQLTPQSAPANNAAAAAVTSAPAYAGRHIFLCMNGGGHFAAMVIALAPRKGRSGSVPMNREATVLAHKTFHRYTTRRKQGGSQSANDNAKGTAHSAGSSLRRYNEQALVDDVRSLLRDWKPLLDTAELLFVRASSTANQRTLFGPYDGQILYRNDPRLRNFPFNTRRPTQKEIMRCFIELTRLKVREISPSSRTPDSETQTTSTAQLNEEDAAAAAQQRQQRQQERRAAAKRAEEEETALLHTAQLQALIRRSKVPALLSYLTTNNLAASTFRFYPPDAAQNHHAPTLLHYAASQNAPALVHALLVRADDDPTVANGDGKTPFELAGDRPTRDAFRVARSELSAVSRDIDWDAARVPAPMTRSEAEQRDAREKIEATRKEAERRRIEEARLKEEAAAEKTKTGNTGSNKNSASQKRPVGVLKSAQEIRQEETRGLTPEQRQRLERERRARAAEARLRQMNAS
ncbi:MAG: hypothetical protein SEPTF4163_004698 [Sporothrix epigloea]